MKSLGSTRLTLLMRHRGVSLARNRIFTGLAVERRVLGEPARGGGIMGEADAAHELLSVTRQFSRLCCPTRTNHPLRVDYEITPLK